MKTLPSILFLVATTVFTACSNNNSASKEAETKNNDTASKATVNNTELKKMGTVNEIISGYLDLKNALATDNGKEGANAANEISAALEKMDESALTSEQKKVYAEVKDDIKEHAEHIEANSSNIEHQREHFDLLSKDVIDLVKATGSSKTLYMDFCPMYNNKKGAYWFSETKEIKNPYFGNKMSGCGEVKEEIKAKG